MENQRYLFTFDLDRQHKELKGQVDGLEDQMERAKEAFIRYARENGLQQVFGTDCQAIEYNVSEQAVIFSVNLAEN